jgi:imidazolonepropionase
VPVLLCWHNTGALSTSLLITSASQLVTLRGRVPRRGAALGALGIIKDGALLVRDGLIAGVGTWAKIEAMPEAAGAEKLDLGGRVVLPGYVDSHTHLIHAASRAEE